MAEISWKELAQKLADQELERQRQVAESWQQLATGFRQSAPIRFIEQTGLQLGANLPLVGPYYRQWAESQGHVFPEQGTAAAVTGDVLGQLATLFAGQGIASLITRGAAAIPGVANLTTRLPAALQTNLARQAGQAALTGATVTGLQYATDPESVTIQDLARNVAFMGGGSLGSGVARQAVHRFLPGVNRFAEAGISGIAGGLAGTAATVPFTEDWSTLPTDALVNAASMALFQTGMTLITPYQPTLDFMRAGRRAGEALGRARDGARAGRSQQVEGARSDYRAAVREMYSAARRVRPDLAKDMPPHVWEQFEWMFERATLRPDPINVTPAAPGVPTGMARQIMQWAQDRAPEQITVEAIKRRFPSMSWQAAQRAYDQLIATHQITPRPPVAQVPVTQPWQLQTPQEAAQAAPVPQGPTHRLDSIIEFLRQLEAQGVDLRQTFGTLGEPRPQQTATAPTSQPVEIPAPESPTPVVTPPQEPTAMAPQVPQETPTVAAQSQPPVTSPETSPVGQAAPAIPIPVSPEDVSFQLARDAHAGSSFTPEERARQVQQAYVSHMEDVSTRLGELAQTPEQQQVLRQELQRYKEGYVQRLNAWLQAKSRTISPMVTGSSKFPAVRNQRALEVEQRRWQELTQWQTRAEAAIRRRLQGARSPERVIDQEFERLKSQIDRGISTLKEIEAGAPYDANLFKQSIAGYIKRAADSGNVEAARRAVEYLREAQKGLRKPAFTDRHSIWRYADVAQQRIEPQPAQASEPEPPTVETPPAQQPTPPSVTEPTPAPEPLTPVRTVATGTTATARTERGTAVETQYAVVEADDLVSSHDTDLRINPRFPQELQPRDRTRAASELQINRIVNTLQPEFLAESPKASEGAPIIGADGVVESGNARTIALKRAYDQGKAESYRQFLIDNAARFGLDPAAVQAASRPVLVRVRQSDVDRTQFVTEANEAAVAAMSATEQAMSDAEKISEGLLSLFQPSEDGDILTPANRQFISSFMQQVVGPAERGRYLTADGRLSQEGVLRIRNAIFARAYGDSEALAKLAESTDNNVRNITGGMLIAAPRFASMREGITAGNLHDLDPTQDIAAAMQKLSQLRESGTDVETYLSQVSMFGDDLSDLAKDFLQTFDKYKRSQKRIGLIMRTYVDLVESLGDPRQGALFGEIGAPTPQELLQTAIMKVEAGYDPRTPQTSLFESEPAAGEVADGPARQLPPEGGRGRPESAPDAGRAADPEIRGLPEATATIAHERPITIGEPDRVITRKEAIDFIEREFMMPVRVGRMHSPRARGSFNLRTHVTRLRRAEDFRALTHEFGHFLSETMPLDPDAYPELQPLGASLYPDAPTSLQREEGLAEFFYLYFSNPSSAQAAAPTFYADFEARLDAEPEFKAKIRQAQELLTAQFRQTGTAAIKAAIVREEAKARPFLTPMQKFYTAWVDDLHPIFLAMKVALGEENITSEWDVQLTQNPYILGRLARGRTRKANVLLTRHQISPDFERVGPSLQEILKPVASRIEDFEAYLVAKRAVELHGRGIDPGVKREDAEAAIRELESEEFRTAQQQLVDFQSNLIDHLIDAGVVNQETADTFRELNKDYVPFYRYFGEETMSGGMAGSRLRWGNLPNPVKKIKGSTRSVFSPLQSIIRNTITMIDIAERNRAARALVDLAKGKKGIGWLIEHIKTPMQPNQVVLERLRKDLIESGIPKQALEEADLDRLAVTFTPVSYARIKEHKENILTVYQNGRPEFYQLHPELYRAMQFMDQPASNWLFRMLTLPTQLLRAGAVLNPEFAARNPVRDQFAAVMHRKYKFRPIIDPARAIFHLFKGEALAGDEMYDLWAASGGAQSTLVSLNRDYLEADLRKMIGERSAREKVISYIRSPITALEWISSVLEEATRLAQFRAGVEAEGRTPEGIRRAAYASREISVDFQRAGGMGRQANQIKAFFNAAIQGTDQMARLWRRDPVGYTIRALVYITLPSILLYLRNRTDPRYQELPRWRRDMYFVWLGEDSITFIPKPFELGVLFGTLPERVLEWIMENDPTAFEEFEDTIFSAVTPGDPRNIVDWLPDAITPLVEVWANRSSFTGRPIVPKSEEQLLPEAQYGPHTTETAKRIGGLLGVSPRQIEHLVKGYGAGLGRHALRLLDALSGVESFDPILRPFGGDPFVSAASLDEFYEELDQLEKLQRTANELRKRGLEAQADANEVRLRELRRVRDDLAALRRLNRSVLENPTMSVDEKRIMNQAINLRMVNLARRALGKPPVSEEGMPPIPYEPGSSTSRPSIPRITIPSFR